MGIRVLTIIGTRPEAIKLFPLIHALDTDSRFESRVCVTGQHRELLDQVLTMAGIDPDHDLDLMRPGQSLDELTAALLTGIGRVLDSENADVVVIQGDTQTAMSAALASHHRKIPVAHIEAGLRSGNIHHPWPEEVNRKIVGTLARWHFTPTESAANALRRENVNPAAIHVTGNTGIDALCWAMRHLQERPDGAAGLAEIERRFAGKRIIGLTCHRRENFGDGMTAVADAVFRLAQRADLAVVFPAHPNPKVRALMNDRLAGLSNVALIEPLDYLHFARLLDISTLMLTDSGGVQEEAPAMGTPVLVLRETTERPEGVRAGTAKLVGTDSSRIVTETERLLDDPRAYAAMAKTHSPFGDGHAAQRIVSLLATCSSGRGHWTTALSRRGAGPPPAPPLQVRVSDAADAT